MWLNLIQCHPYICSGSRKSFVPFFYGLFWSPTYLITLSLKKKFKSLKKFLNFGSKNLYQSRKNYVLSKWRCPSSNFTDIRGKFVPPSKQTSVKCWDAEGWYLCSFSTNHSQTKQFDFFRLSFQQPWHIFTNWLMSKVEKTVEGSFKTKYGLVC